MRILYYIIGFILGFLTACWTFAPVDNNIKQIKKELSECKSYSLGLEQIIKHYDKRTSKQIIKNIQNEQNCKNK